MKIKTFTFFIILFTTASYACDDSSISKYTGSNSNHLIQALNSEKIHKGSSIYFISDNNEHPEVKALFSPDRCHPERSITFDTFSYDGSIANIESVFWGKGLYKGNLFIIVSWVYNLDGVNTVGKYYSVYAYNYSESEITKNTDLTNKFGEGQDGLMEGKPVKYKFKTAENIWSYLKEVKNEHQ